MSENNCRHIFPGSSQYVASTVEMFPVPEFADCGDAFVPRTTINLRDYYMLYNPAPEDEAGRWHWLWPWQWNWQCNWPWNWLWHWLLAWQWPWQLHGNSEQVEIFDPYIPEKPINEPVDFLLYDYYDTESEDLDVYESDLVDSAVEDSEREESNDDGDTVDSNKLPANTVLPRSEENVSRMPKDTWKNYRFRKLPATKETPHKG